MKENKPLSLINYHRAKYRKNEVVKDIRSKANFNSNLNLKNYSPERISSILTLPPIVKILKESRTFSPDSGGNDL